MKTFVERRKVTSHVLPKLKPRLKKIEQDEWIDDFIFAA